MNENSEGAFCTAIREPVAVTIVRAVASCTNEPMTELEPLFDVVDVDALDALVSHGAECRVEFTYEGCIVGVSPSEVCVELQE